MKNPTVLPNGLFNLNQLKDPSKRTQNIETIRRLTQVAYQGNHIAVCRMLGQFLTFVSTHDERHGVQLQMNGYWEMETTVQIAASLKRGFKAVDVGANYGYFSFLMARLCGPDGHVWSIEANPFIHNLLVKSIKVNGLKKQVTPLNLAISDQNLGPQPFVYSSRTPMNGSLRENKADHVLKNKITDETLVETTTLDSILGAEKIDLMKIDIEGSEHKMWLGSSQLRQNNPKMVIIMEFNRMRYEDADGFVDSIFKEGYQVSEISLKGLRPVDQQDLLTSSTAQHMMLQLNKP